MSISMIRRISLAFLSATLLSSVAMAQEKYPNLARWEWVIMHDKGKPTMGTFKATVTGEITHGSGKDKMQVGTWKPLGDGRIQATLTAGPLKGKIDVKLSPTAKTPTYEGEIVHEGGKKEKIVFVLIAD